MELASMFEPPPVGTCWNAFLTDLSRKIMFKSNFVEKCLNFMNFERISQIKIHEGLDGG